MYNVIVALCKSYTVRLALIAILLPAANKRKKNYKQRKAHKNNCAN